MSRCLGGGAQESLPRAAVPATRDHRDEEERDSLIFLTLTLMDYTWGGGDCEGLGAAVCTAGNGEMSPLPDKSSLTEKQTERTLRWGFPDAGGRLPRFTREGSKGHGSSSVFPASPVTS